MIAEIFKDEKFYDKSRELRDKARGLQVNVNYTDFNEFIRQLKESGGTVAYRCGKCGADLKIDGKSTGKCDYCGSELAILPELIKAMPLTLK
jgi:DNA-directed RNA polymerase subunit RPC12/RpoP